MRQQARKVLAFCGSPNQMVSGELDRAWIVVESGRDGQIRHRINRMQSCGKC